MVFNLYETQTPIVPSVPDQNSDKICCFVSDSVVADIIAYTQTLMPQSNP